MQTVCPIKEHSKATLTHICSNPDCQQNRLLCTECFNSTHKDCTPFLLHIDSISKKDLRINKNWIRDQDIRQTALYIEDNKLVDGPDQLVKVAQNQIENEAQKLIEFFTQEVNTQKENMITRVKDVFAGKNLDVSIDEFNKKLKTIYDMNPLIEIISRWRRGTDNFDTMNTKVNKLLKESRDKQEQDTELKDQALKLNSQIAEAAEIIRTDVFEEFKKVISMEMPRLFPNEAMQDGKNDQNEAHQTWGWDRNKKSRYLSCYSDTYVTKEMGYPWRDSAVLGNVALNQGRHRWRIQTYSNPRWVCFGIVEQQFSKNLEFFPYQNANGFSLLGERFQMEGNKTLEVYHEVTYLCDLNFDAGTFTIFAGEAVIAYKTDGIRNKTFYPFVVLHFPGNRIVLEVLGPKDK